MATADVSPGSSPDFDLRWSYTVHLDETYRFRLRTRLSYYDDPTINTLIGDLFVPTGLPDERARWHRNYTPLQRWIRAHILRKARGWSISRLESHLSDNPEYALELGFIDRDDAGRARPDPPGYTQLRTMWAETFDARMRGAVTVIAERLVELARDEGIPAPEDVFTPDPEPGEEDVGEDGPTVRELTIEKTADVWEHIRPMVLNHWSLKRHHNAQIPDSQFFDAHATLAADSDDVYPESGLGNYQAKGVIEGAHYPSTHRRELSRFDVEEIRELHRRVVKDLIAEARREGELVGKLKVAIDETKGHPWTGTIERNEDGDNIEPWRLGYKNDNDTRTQYYYKWAAIQVVGFDIPIVLDALPVRRGMTKGEIVGDLLDSATDLLDDFELVLMDGGFDSEASKTSVEAHHTYYINRKSRDSDDKRRMREMWSADRADREAIRVVEEEDRIGRSNRKTIYVPKTMVDDGEDDDEEDGEEDESMRQGLLEEFGATVEDDDADEEFPEKSPFEALLSDIHDEEDDDGEDEVDPTEMYVVFETNHPLAAKKPGRSKEGVSEREQQQAAARIVRLYDSRWGIENGFKKDKTFLPRSASPNHVLRFFGFIFACTLCNAWRLVDILVKLSVEDNPAYTPLVTASRFMAVMEGQIGLKPPPETA